ncbi:MAG: hypothetical protein JXA13_05905, partial [Anaerolineales bacterium]|nr:hypothetical protein [Anaerolineales bacterium]
MSSKKLTVFVSMLFVLSMILGACGPKATPADAPAAKAGGLMCVIVPSVENPFFGSEQSIAIA